MTLCPSEQRSGLPTYVGSPICPYCQRAELILRDSGMPVRWCFVNLLELRQDVERARRELGRRSPEREPSAGLPTGRVPVLWLPSETLFESGAIVEYVADLYPHYLPATPAARARMRGFCAAVDSLQRELRICFTAKTREGFEASIERLREGITDLVRLDAPLPSSGFTLAHAYALPFLSVVAVLERGPIELLTLEARAHFTPSLAHSARARLTPREPAMAALFANISSYLIDRARPALRALAADECGASAAQLYFDSRGPS